MKSKIFTPRNIVLIGMFLFLIVFAIGVKAQSNVWTAKASNNWNNTSTWTKTSGTGSQTTPIAGDVVNIGGNFTVTVNTTGLGCASIQLGLDGSGESGTLKTSGTSNLTVTGTIQLGEVLVGGGHTSAGTITMVSGGTITAGSIVNGGNTHDGTITLVTGATINVGTISTGASGGAAANYDFSAGILKTTGSFTMPTNTTPYNSWEVVSGTCTLSEASIITTLTVDNGATFAGSTFAHTINTALTVNGTLSGSGVITLAGVTIDGSGSFTNTNALDITAASSFNPMANLSITPTIAISNTTTVTNNGSVTSTSTSGITGANVNSIWLNSTNASLIVVGPFLAIGSLTATASGNTVTYGMGGSTSNIVKATTYTNLVINEGSGTATISTATITTGALTISTGTLTVGTNLTIKGDFTNNSTFNGTANFNGTTLQNIFSANSVFSALTINNSAGINLLDDITITTTFNMTSGNIKLNGNNITLGASSASLGTLNYTSGFLTDNGSFSRWIGTTTFAVGTTGQFPMGTLTGSNARNFWLAPTTAATTAGIVTVSQIEATGPSYKTAITTYTDGSLSGVNVHNNTSWTVSSSTLNGGTYSIRIEGAGIGANGGISSNANAALLTISNGTGNPGGTYAVSTGTIADPVVNRTAMTLAQLDQTFFIAGQSGTNPLPVTLVSFNANYENNQVNLNWSTASEINNHYFNVERSVDGQTWTNIAQVEGHGNSLVTQNYFTTDNLAGIIPAGDIYYRLEQVDFNGATAYSMIRSVNITKTPVVTVNTYPNPAVNVLNVSWISESSSNAILNLVNMAGSTVYSENVTSLGTVHKQIDMTNYPTGTYFIQVISDNSVSTQTVVKK